MGLPYRPCSVTGCGNSNKTAPEKLYFHVPNLPETRNKWLKLAGRDPDKISVKSTIYFCEDHFDLPNDMENYMQYKLMGSVKRIKIRSSCFPSKFEHTKRSDTIPNNREITLTTLPMDNKSQQGVQPSELLEKTETNVHKNQINSEEYKGPKDVEITKSQCMECGEPIKGFEWWCLQCSGARCVECAARAAHGAHFLLRAPPAATHEQTQTVIAAIRQHLQKENVVQHEIANGDRHALDADGSNLDIMKELEKLDLPATKPGPASTQSRLGSLQPSIVKDHHPPDSKRPRVHLYLTHSEQNISDTAGLKKCNRTQRQKDKHSAYNGSTKKNKHNRKQRSIQVYTNYYERFIRYTARQRYYHNQKQRRKQKLTETAQQETTHNKIQQSKSNITPQPKIKITTATQTIDENNTPEIQVYFSHGEQDITGMTEQNTDSRNTQEPETKENPAQTEQNVLDSTEQNHNIKLLLYADGTFGLISESLTVPDKNNAGPVKHEKDHNSTRQPKSPQYSAHGQNLTDTAKQNNNLNDIRQSEIQVYSIHNEQKITDTHNTYMLDSTEQNDTRSLLLYVGSTLELSTQESQIPVYSDHSDRNTTDTAKQNNDHNNTLQPKIQVYSPHSEQNITDTPIEQTLLEASEENNNRLILYIDNALEIIPESLTVLNKNITGNINENNTNNGTQQLEIPIFTNHSEQNSTDSDKQNNDPNNTQQPEINYTHSEQNITDSQGEQNLLEATGHNANRLILYVDNTLEMIPESLKVFNINMTGSVAQNNNGNRTRQPDISIYSNQSEQNINDIRSEKQLLNTSEQNDNSLILYVHNTLEMMPESLNALNLVNDLANLDYPDIEELI